MQRIAPGALYALALWMGPAEAMAEDVAPFIEYQVAQKGFPPRTSRT